MGNKFYIDSDIKKAETLPASFYKDEQIFKELKEKIFLKSKSKLVNIDFDF